jgi:hypothetical protein
MVLSIIFLEDKHTFLLHLSIFYEYMSINSFYTLTPHGKKMQVKEIYVIFIPLNSGILLIIDLNKKKGKKGGGNFICEFYSLNKCYVSTV